MIQDTRCWNDLDNCYTIPEAQDGFFTAECDSCVGCHRDGEEVVAYQFPVLYRPRAHEIGVWPDGSFTAAPVNSMVATAEFMLCRKCGKRADAIAKVSSFVSTGRDWWDFADGLMCRVEDSNWTQKTGEEWVTGSTRATIKILERGLDQPESILYGIPTDIIITLLPKQLSLATQDSMATKIQKCWKNYKFRMYNPANENKTWQRCEDCGSCRQMDQLVNEEACADSQCCWKRICRKRCHIKCSDCREIFGFNVANYLNNGDETIVPCPCCGQEQVLNESWNGLTVAQHMARYG